MRSSFDNEAYGSMSSNESGVLWGNHVPHATYKKSSFGEILGEEGFILECQDTGQEVYQKEGLPDSEQRIGR